MRWPERQIFGWLLSAGALTGAIWAIAGMTHPAFLPVAAVAGSCSVAVFFALMQIKPHVRCGGDAVTVQNTADAYVIPWNAIRGIRFDRRRGLQMHLAEGEVLVVEAFANWPGFGRQERVRQELEAAWALRRDSTQGDTVIRRPSGGRLELVLATPVAVMLVSLLVAGIQHLAF